MKRTTVLLIAATFLVSLTATRALSHCQIPCGIYGDEARFQMMEEHITTMAKSMKSIQDLQGEKPINYNQLVRWVMNKENHANELQQIVTQYFMAQRIKIDMKDYAKKLNLLHKILIYTMKCKQTTDISHIGTLNQLLEEFHGLYFGHTQK